MEMEYIWGMLERGSSELLSLWPIKLFLCCLGGAWCWAFDGTGAIFAVVLGFVVLDTLSKWWAITKKYMEVEMGIPSEKINVFGVICSWLSAWKKGYLESSELRRCWGDKLFAYGLLVIVAGLVGKLPETFLLGIPVNKTLSGGIYSCMAITELLSIIENLEEGGYTKLSSFKKLLESLSARVTGTTVNVSLGARPIGTPTVPPIIDHASSTPVNSTLTTNSNISNPGGDVK